MRLRIRANLVYFAFGVLICWCFTPMANHIYESTRATPPGLIRLNTDIVDQISYMADILDHSSGIIRRYSHFVEEPDENHICPECERCPVEMYVYPDEPADVYKKRYSLEDVEQDSKEVLRSLVSMRAGMEIQASALRYHLSQLRKGKQHDPRKDVEPSGQRPVGIRPEPVVAGSFRFRRFVPSRL